MLEELTTFYHTTMSKKSEASSRGICTTAGGGDGVGRGGGSVSRPVKGKRARRPRRSSHHAEEDEMYFSPLDSSPEVYFIGLLLVLLASIWTRLHRIAEPDHVA